jgi:hypothetical protein
MYIDIACSTTVHFLLFMLRKVSLSTILTLNINKHSPHSFVYAMKDLFIYFVLTLNIHIGLRTNELAFLRNQRNCLAIKHFLWSKDHLIREYLSFSTCLPVAPAQTGPLQSYWFRLVASLKFSIALVWGTYGGNVWKTSGTKEVLTHTYTVIYVGLELPWSHSTFTTCRERGGGKRVGN